MAGCQAEKSTIILLVRIVAQLATMPQWCIFYKRVDKFWRQPGRLGMIIIFGADCMQPHGHYHCIVLRNIFPHRVGEHEDCCVRSPVRVVARPDVHRPWSPIITITIVSAAHAASLSRTPPQQPLQPRAERVNVPQMQRAEIGEEMLIHVALGVTIHNVPPVTSSKATLLLQFAVVDGAYIVAIIPTIGGR